MIHVAANHLEGRGSGRDRLQPCSKAGNSLSELSNLTAEKIHSLHQQSKILTHSSTLAIWQRQSAREEQQRWKDERVDLAAAKVEPSPNGNESEQGKSTEKSKQESKANGRPGHLTAVKRAREAEPPMHQPGETQTAQVPRRSKNPLDLEIRKGSTIFLRTQGWLLVFAITHMTNPLFFGALTFPFQTGLSYKGFQHFLGSHIMRQTTQRVFQKQILRPQQYAVRCGCAQHHTFRQHLSDGTTLPGCTVQTRIWIHCGRHS